MEFLPLLSADLERGHEEAVVGEFEANHRVGHASDFVKIIHHIPDVLEVLRVKGPVIPVLFKIPSGSPGEISAIVQRHGVSFNLEVGLLRTIRRPITMQASFLLSNSKPPEINQ